jgi:hypothetical protein
MTSMEQVKSTIYVDNPRFWSRSLQFAKLVHQNMFQTPTSFVCKNICSNATCHHYLLLLLLLCLLVNGSPHFAKRNSTVATLYCYLLIWELDNPSRCGQEMWVSSANTSTEAPLITIMAKAAEPITELPLQWCVYRRFSNTSIPHTEKHPPWPMNNPFILLSGKLPTTTSFALLGSAWLGSELNLVWRKQAIIDSTPPYLPSFTDLKSF